MKTKNLAFTMAEILLSLTIIGVVAAITLPSLTGNINERTWNTQRKALYARMSQAVALMPALNGMGSTTYGESGSITNDSAGQTFVTELGNVLKINNVCDNAHLQDCGIVSKFMPMGGNSEMDTPKTLYELNSWFQNVSYNTESMSVSFSTPNTNAIAFETQNGESIVTYYNPKCKTEYLNETGLNQWNGALGVPEATMCANFVYDLNGKKGPNTVGKDIGFITVFNSMDSVVVAPLPSATNNANNNTALSHQKYASTACTTQDPDSRVPNIDELDAMLINKKLINLANVPWYWSSTITGSQAWFISQNNGYRASCPPGNSGDTYIRCVKR